MSEAETPIRAAVEEIVKISWRLAAVSDLEKIAEEIGEVAFSKTYTWEQHWNGGYLSGPKRSNQMATVKIKYVDESNNVVEAEAKTLQMTIGDDIYSVQFKKDKAIIYLVSMFSLMTISPGAFNMVAIGAQKVE